MYRGYIKFIFFPWSSLVHPHASLLYQCFPFLLYIHTLCVLQKRQITLLRLSFTLLVMPLPSPWTSLLSLHKVTHRSQEVRQYTLFSISFSHQKWHQELTYTDLYLLKPHSWVTVALRHSPPQHTWLQAWSCRHLDVALYHPVNHCSSQTISPLPLPPASPVPALIP